MGFNLVAVFSLVPERVGVNGRYDFSFLPLSWSRRFNRRIFFSEGVLEKRWYRNIVLFYTIVAIIYDYHDGHGEQEL